MKSFMNALLLSACLPALSVADAFLIGGGLNLSSTDIRSDDVDYSPRVGFNVGIGFEKQVTPTFYLVPGLGLETRGQKVEGDVFGSTLEATLKMLYLQIPVMAMVKVPAGNGSLQFFVGPSLGINLSSEIEASYQGETETQDMKDQTNGTDFGIEFGAGVEFPAGNGSLFIRPAYYLGLTEALDTEDKLRNFKLQVGFRIPVGAENP